MNRGARSRFLAFLTAAGLALTALTLASPGASGAAPTVVQRPSGEVGGVDLGPHVTVFTPDMPQSEIQAAVDAIAARQLGNQFGDERDALLFAPGTYGSAEDPLNFQVGYYTQVAGLGQNPSDVVINGSVDVYNQCENGSCFALNNFWRSLSNLTISVAGKEGCQVGEFWATSQASSMRRVRVEGNGKNITLMDYCTPPSYASGGFIADSSFDGQIINGSQQQWITRNSELTGWSNSVWNQVFVGTKGAPADSFGGGEFYTTVDQTPVQSEMPYLYVAGRGGPAVFVPSAQTDTTGTSWSATSSTPGRSIPLSDFFVATPDSTVAQMNRALAAGRHLLLTPGVYRLPSAIKVTRADTVVLGLGLATLEPTTGKAAMTVAGQPGTSVSGVIFDAGPVKSPVLLAMQPSESPSSSPSSSSATDPAQPSALHDVYLRVGGAHEGKVDTALSVSTSNVVLDNVWSWRADHGTGVGWTDNTATTGLAVRGADVTAYGLFVEHYQGDEVVWKGPRGSIYLLQNEMPYDPPSQAAWNTTPAVLGHAALSVRPGADGFRGWGLGSYSFFNQGVDIHASRAFAVASGVDAQVHHALTVFLDPSKGSGGIDSVINGVGGSSTAANPGTPVTVTDYPIAGAG